MARYIDAEEITRRILYFYHHTNNGSGEHYAYAKALSQIDHTPTADVVEVKHGEWIECSNELNKYCSVCKKVLGTIYERPPFCENCGAIMDGGKAE